MDFHWSGSSSAGYLVPGDPVLLAARKINQCNLQYLIISAATMSYICVFFHNNNVGIMLKCI